MFYDKNFVWTDSLIYPVSKATGKPSELIQALWYNENSNTLLVVLKDFYQNPAYLYEGVTPFVWESFKAAQSFGAFYNREIKGRYGPAEHWGGAENIGVEKEAVKDRGAVGTPKDLTYSDNAVVDGIKVGASNLVQNPSFEVVDGGGETTEDRYFDLTVVPEPEGEVDPDDEFIAEWNARNGDDESGWEFEVTFVDSENPSKELVRKVTATDVEEALTDVYEVAEMLDREFVVKKVEVRFE